jgi:hypothetical protein
MATSQGCSGSHPPEYHCSGCDLIGQQYRFMLAAWAHPIGCHSVYIWAHCSGAHPIATHTDYPYRLSSLVGLSPDCHLVYIWARHSGVHPCSAGWALTRLPFARCLVSLFGSAPDCHPYILAGQALTRLPFGRYLGLPFGRASDCYPCRFTCQSGSHPIALRYIFVLAIWAYTQLLPVQRRSGSHPIAIR